MRSQIRIKPIGGLGNQLFIWAFAKKLQNERPQSKILAATGHFDDYPWHNYELDSFDSGVREVLSHQSRKCVTLAKRISVLGPILPREIVLAERSSAYNPDFGESPPGNLRLSGYFQSWKYFSTITEEIRNSIANVREPSSWFASNPVKEIVGDQDWIAIHIRIGNYLSHTEMGVLSDRYYSRAVGELNQYFPSTTPRVIFTDTPQGVAHYQSVLSAPNVHILRTPPESRPIETLLLMSHASALVMGNSTFSWWAGFLGDHESRPVFFPKPWHTSPELDSSDFVLPQWKGIPSTFRKRP